jgi:hypothetical protein
MNGTGVIIKLRSIDETKDANQQPEWSFSYENRSVADGNPNSVWTRSVDAIKNPFICQVKQDGGGELKRMTKENTDSMLWTKIQPYLTFNEHLKIPVNFSFGNQFVGENSIKIGDGICDSLISLPAGEIAR